jgi:putative phosphoribosyl transferase
MYFRSRSEAGEQLADRLIKYRFEDCAVVALSANSVVVAEPIAARLHCVLGLFLSESIKIPGEGVTVGTVDQEGEFTYNSDLTETESGEYYSEYHGYIDDQKREKFEHINKLLGEGGVIDPGLLREHVVILVADGLKTSAKLDAAAEFLKPILMKRLIVVTPVASVLAVDAMHMLADEIHCLSVTENYLATSHYYDAKDTLTHDQAVEKINNIILNWR